MELHKRRKALTEPEVRCLFRQTVLAVSYLHSVKVIIIIIISMIIGRGKQKITNNDANRLLLLLFFFIIGNRLFIVI